MFVGDMFLKIFTHKHCSNLALVGSQFIFRNSALPISALFSSLKQTLMHLFWGILIFLGKRLLRFGYHAEHVCNRNVAVSAHYRVNGACAGKNL